MTRDDEGTAPRHEEDSAGADHDATEQTDPTQNPAPPGNPETDQEAVDKGEEQIGKIVGR